MELDKPRVFIGSARESIEYVNAVHAALSYYAEVTPWSAGAFKPLNYTMEDLETQLDQNDFAVFIFSPDDIVNMRGKTSVITRDNTLFEMGLFWGRLRRGRVFYLIPNTVPKLLNDTDIEGYHLPSDLIGISALTYEVRDNQNFVAAVNVACGYIAQQIKELGHYEDPALLLEEARLRQKERDAIALFTLKLTKELIYYDHTKIYEYLSDSLRSVYAIHPLFSLDGVGVWKKENNDGLRHVAGKAGYIDFYPFSINDNKKEDDDNRILVVDSFLKGEELVLLTKDHLFKTYLICYPIGNELVITVSISGSTLLSDDEIETQILANYDLMKTINYLFGGASR
ncbi:nucleotide-binding protein [Heyndrickxia sp. NPDC080065]|uniref:nucleotide-binding protein n=1 Tax=Heyndrickxia sp. NPDC080065 TaxID=3390568 RepID=UPI003D000F93